MEILIPSIVITIDPVIVPVITTAGLTLLSQRLTKRYRQNRRKRKNP
jgi:hypothetical protein